MKKKFPKLHAALLRSAQSVPVLIGVVVISFVLTRALPGDPAVYFAGAAADEQSINEIRVAMGLDKTLYEQFFVYVNNLLDGIEEAPIQDEQDSEDNILKDSDEKVKNVLNN